MPDALDGAPFAALFAFFFAVVLVRTQATYWVARLVTVWTLDRTSVSLYLDVQNVYNRIFPEVWIYTSDWADRSSLVGLPIYPSLGVMVDF